MTPCAWEVMTKTDIARNGGLSSSIARFKKMFLLFDSDNTGACLLRMESGCVVT